MSITSLEKYLDNRIKNSKNELSNPRSSFNSGYHSANQALESNWELQDLTNHFDPYYIFGYEARIKEYNQGIKYHNDSTFCWHKYLESLSSYDFITVSRSVLESIIIGREYLFSQKLDRKDFTSHNWDNITQNYYTCMFANSRRQLAIMESVLSLAIENV